jgi:hypothetical protein
MDTLIEYHPGRGYKVNQVLSAGDGLMVYATRKMAGDVARMGGWKRSDVVKVWGPLFGGYMPAYASTRGDGKQSLIFLTTDLLSREFAIEEMPIRRQAQ